ncbi:hypothetical protein [Polyangium aurulentum]|uniref:hypothetical protein n=1 Tax=Polyangium aurulentum TaxID=2567896 RepID=UPI0010AE68A5|nr:hypothetical protein [Polyangium aurulentum]UQA57506.1 hypothetical protein E8A73_040520 [Polyangium aurulentum]
MRRLRDNDGSTTHRRHIRFHMARCKGAGPLHDILHSEATAVYAVLRDAERAREDAEDAAVEAAALVTRAEETLENVIRDIDAEAKKIDRAEPTLMAQSTILPGGLTPILEPEGAAQLDVLPALGVRLAPFKGKGAMKDAVSALENAEAGMRAALEAAAATEIEVERRFAEELGARRAVREQLSSAHGRLRDLYKARPALAERFFLKEKEAPRAKSSPLSLPAPPT